MAVDVGTIAAVAGALGVGSVIGQWMASGKDRRTARAAALQAMNEVERSRWMPHNLDEVPFHQAMRDLQTATLLAQVPRRQVRTYLILAQASYWSSDASWKEESDPDFGGGIPTAFADAVSDAARILADTIWAPPAFRRVRFHCRLNRLLKKIGSIDDNETRDNLARARRTVT